MGKNWTVACLPALCGWRCQNVRALWPGLSVISAEVATWRPHATGYNAPCTKGCVATPSNILAAMAHVTSSKVGQHRSDCTRALSPGSRRCIAWHMYRDIQKQVRRTKRCVHLCERQPQQGVPRRAAAQTRHVKCDSWLELRPLQFRRRLRRLPWCDLCTPLCGTTRRSRAAV